MKKTLFVLAALSLSACMGEEPAKVITLSGKTMGTTYNITAVGVPDDLEEAALSGDVEAVLADVNAKMSNWDKNSEVSRFNVSEETAPVEISADFVTVMTAANEVHKLSDGKFDVTLGPLIELWGFGPRKPDDPVPSDEDIEAALAFVGQAEKLSLDPEASVLSKSAPEVGINLSAIAKGFGIDAVAAKLKALGIDNYMVEIGGDLVASGHNDKGAAWKIGIEKPEPGEKAVEQVVSLEDKGLATSGDYRNFVEHEGVRYSHIIDPVTGKPITHWTTSVSVVADDAMMADAWATAMLVLGSERGLEAAEANNIAVFFISRDETADKSAYVTQASSAFEALLKEK
ncbi:thiamine biosynthesis lipoprotein [Labrenzia sp. EL_208]|uniref:FAD:protein FMN transferase n=1 Tax=Roseibium album TaxID=311410 RepID=UPI000CF060A6|nr:thiamine biosynthesis lipoprotein [Labrenzia sp. EL_142]MBG6178035.1 thiamine biosynthesis lipoprotein [Labrenzia sp. EL_132]MBG6204944.1 thiamine biosynthesis lipoprotein [Labrenzia sp. EL_13]MBG6210661.1 thiamine biosynthesis lipoprotein [Labrenzia sp. EL_126]MBG6232658.1 thiamine biosynthesis lipoprotein [Labrenzia sp. EL_208]